MFTIKQVHDFPDSQPSYHMHEVNDFLVVGPAGGDRQVYMKLSNGDMHEMTVGQHCIVYVMNAAGKTVDVIDGHLRSANVKAA